MIADAEVGIAAHAGASLFTVRQIIEVSSLDMSYPPSHGKSQKLVPVKT
jgi:hypothetical protein